MRPSLLVAAALLMVGGASCGGSVARSSESRPAKSSSDTAEGYALSDAEAQLFAPDARVGRLTKCMQQDIPLNQAQAFQGEIGGRTVLNAISARPGNFSQAVYIFLFQAQPDVERALPILGREFPGRRFTRGTNVPLVEVWENKPTRAQTLWLDKCYVKIFNEKPEATVLAAVTDVGASVTVRLG
jgi:hypothetical protein